MESTYLQKILAGRNRNPTIVGIRHQIGLCRETHWLDDVNRWLGKRVNLGDKVMLEIPEYPLGDSLNVVPTRVKLYMKCLVDHLEQIGAEIIPGEDKQRWGIDNFYHDEYVRDNEVFIPRMREIKPRFFLVGYSHLDYLKEKMPEFSYVNLVNEEKDEKTSPWLNVNFNKYNLSAISKK